MTPRKRNKKNVTIQVCVLLLDQGGFKIKIKIANFLSVVIIDVERPLPDDADEPPVRDEESPSPSPSPSPLQDPPSKGKGKRQREDNEEIDTNSDGDASQKSPLKKRKIFVDDYISAIRSFTKNLRGSINQAEPPLTPGEPSDALYPEIQSATKDELTKWNFSFSKHSEQMEVNGRIGRAISAMYMWLDVCTVDGELADKQAKTANIDRVLGISEDQSVTAQMKTRFKIRKSIQVGKHMVQHVIAFGWAILLWNDFAVNTMLHKPAQEIRDLWEYLKDDTQAHDQIRGGIDSQISREDAREKVIKIVGSMCGNEQAASLVIDKLNSIDSSFFF